MMLLRDKYIRITCARCFEFFSFNLILDLVTEQSSVIFSHGNPSAFLFLFYVCYLGTKTRAESHVYLLQSSH